MNAHLLKQIIISETRRFSLGLVLFLVSLMIPEDVVSEPVTLDERSTVIRLDSRARVLEDMDRAFSVENVISDETKGLWSQSESENLNYGYTDSVFWIRTELVNASSNPLKFFVEIGYPVLDHVDVHVIRSTSRDQWLMGDKHPFHERFGANLNFVCPVRLDSGETVTLLLRVETSSSMQIPLYVYNPHAFLKMKQLHMMVFGLYYGAMIIMALYNFFLFLSVRESDYLYYVLYVLSQCVFLAGLNGLSFKYLWPDMTRWNDQSIVVSLAIMIFSGSLFVVRFLKLTRGSGRSYSLFVFSAVAACAVAALLPAIPYKTGLFIATTLAVCLFIFGIPAVFIRWFKGFKPGRFFVLAWISLAAGVFVLVLNKLGLAPRNFFTENSTQIGSVLQVMLLSFALADRLNTEKKEKIEAQNMAHAEERNARMANENAILNERLARESRERAYAIQKKATETLEQEVLDRTGRLNETLEKGKAANHQIMSSLRYARMIQLAMLPDPEKIKTCIPRHVILWAPRDIVGGDFYYVDQIKGGYIVAVADCTGHGVPGAFMTIIANSELKRIIKGEFCYDPAEILTRLNRRIRKVLKQDTKKNLSDDGLDIGVCAVNVETGRMEFAGAKIDLVFMKDGEIYTLKGDRQSVGYVSGGKHEYTRQDVAVERGMIVYLYTDGITDQLGERSGQRFGTRRLKDLIKEYSGLPVKVQCEIIKASSDVYRGQRDQVDDMTLVAFEVV